MCIGLNAELLDASKKGRLADVMRILRRKVRREMKANIIVGNTYAALPAPQASTSESGAYSQAITIFQSSSGGSPFTERASSSSMGGVPPSKYV